MSRASPIRLDWAVIAVIVIVAIGGYLYLSGQRQVALRNSPAGFDGLRVWLTSEGHAAQSHAGGWPLNRETVGLLVQPIYDTRLDMERAPARTREELLAQPDELDQKAKIIRDKAKTVPSLIVLPKWRSGMRLTGLGHPALRVPRKDVEQVLRDVLGDKGEKRVRYMPQPFSDFEYEDGDLTARIYAAQVFDANGCEPIVGRPGAMLLGKCRSAASGWKPVYVLSDPDLLNNHGLRLGDNARIAADLLPKLAGPQKDDAEAVKRVVIDYSPANWLTSPERIVERKRSWADLKRLFAYPFSVLWAGAAAWLALALWRGGLRDGPVLRLRGPRAGGKRAANRARAHLMRLTGQDGALLSDYVTTRMQVLAETLFGQGKTHLIAGEAAVLRHLKSHCPDLATGLENTLSEIRALPVHLHAADAIAQVDRFERILEQIARDT